MRIILVILAADEKGKRLPKRNTKIYYKSILEFRCSYHHRRSRPDAYYDSPGLAFFRNSFSLGSFVCESYGYARSHSAPAKWDAGGNNVKCLRGNRYGISV